MKVMNIMLSRNGGGIEQCFLDYDKALKSQGFETISISSFFAKVNKHIHTKFKLPNLANYDLISCLVLKIFIIFLKPKIIITHGNRALNFVHTTNTKIPIITIAHNDQIDRKLKSDYIIALTKYSHSKLLLRGFKEEQILQLPNMFQCRADFCERQFKKPIVIGVVSRFVKKKGIDIFIKALDNLNKQKIDFKAIIGGSGLEKNQLIALAKQLDLNDRITFVGWVEDTKSFFDSIDIFCLPSIEEPFGISLLEAIGNSVPVIASRTEGPDEMIQHLENGLLFVINSHQDLSKNIKYMINNQIQAREMAYKAFVHLKQEYEMTIVAEKLKNIVNLIGSKNVT